MADVTPVSLTDQLTRAKRQFSDIQKQFSTVQRLMTEGEDAVELQRTSDHVNIGSDVRKLKFAEGMKSLLTTTSNLLENIGDMLYSRGRKARDGYKSNDKRGILHNNVGVIGVNCVEGSLSDIAFKSEEIDDSDGLSDDRDSLEALNNDSDAKVRSGEGRRESGTESVQKNGQGNQLNYTLHRVSDLGNDLTSGSETENYDEISGDYFAKRDECGVKSMENATVGDSASFRSAQRNCKTTKRVRNRKNIPPKLSGRDMKKIHSKVKRLEKEIGDRFGVVKIEENDSENEIVDGNDAENSENVENFYCCFCSDRFRSETDLQNHRCRGTNGALEKEFPCTTCGSLFGSFGKWWRHQRLSHVGVKCEICGDRFDGLRGLEQHSRKHDAETGIERKFCDVCERSYSVSKEMHDRMLHGGSGAVKCEICRDVFTDRLALDRHVQTKHECGAATSHDCSVCGKSFGSLLAVNVHKASHAEKRYKCDVCGKTCRTQSVFKRHLKRHSKDDNLTCELCDKTFKSRHWLKKHLQDHANKKEFPCKICGKSFKSRMNMNIHQAVHSERTFQCSSCPKKFSSNSRKNRHELSHSTHKPHVCPKCEKSFTLLAHLRSHLYHMHSAQRPMYACDKCGKTHRSLSGHREHARSHDGVKPFVCDECGNSFYDARSLKSHQRVHTGEKPFHCDVCGKDYAHRTTLRGHQRLHTGLKSSICAVCGKTFLDNARLAVHAKIHTATKDQHCQICDKYYVNRVCLQIHITRMHKGIKPEPYACIHCGRRFTQSSHRDAHVRGSHTGERPFACTDCGKTFISKGDLTKHGRRHSGIRPYVCGVCHQAFAYSSSLKKHGAAHALPQSDPPGPLPAVVVNANASMTR